MNAIREAVKKDASGILSIYNDVIANSTAIYTEDAVTLEDRLAWLEARQTKKFPVLVACDDTGVTGYASFEEFRPWPGYRFTVELGVYVRADRRRRGIGRELIQALFPFAAHLGMHIMIAGIDARNEASLALHQKLGFQKVAHLKEVGFKFGRWLDLILLQRPILLPSDGA
jgi:L-amino acid N-acyltransferase YncA